MTFGECDACGKNNRVLTLCVVYGIDTAACHECTGNGGGDDEADELAAEIEYLKPKAETGDHHARICAMEARYVELTGGQLPHG